MCSLTGRLGNQLFQYAFARSLQKQYGGRIVCNTFSTPSPLRELILLMISSPMPWAISSWMRMLRSRMSCPWYADFSSPLIKPVKKLFPRRYFDFMARRGYLMWQRTDYMPIPKLECEGVFAWGWWQDIRYFQDVQTELSDEVVPVIWPENQYIYNAASEESVCIPSIRCGNYFNPTVKKLTCAPRVFPERC